MTSTPEAPVAEPQPVRRARGGRRRRRHGRRAAAVRIHRVAHAFGELARDRATSTLAVAAGEVLGLVGPSGCGKSTLLELISGLREPSAGAIAVGGDRRRRGAARPLRLHAAARPAPALAVGDRQRGARALRNRGASRAAARRAAHPLFERFGLAGFERARPSELSGGMRQRIAFLRTLLAGKPVLLLDEPFASLDAITRAEMQEWLAEAPRRRVADHDPRHPRRRGGPLPVRPGGGALGAPGSRGRRAAPAVAARPAAHRARSPRTSFTAARERALAALTGGRR